MSYIEDVTIDDNLTKDDIMRGIFEEKKKVFIRLNAPDTDKRYEAQQELDLINRMQEAFDQLKDDAMLVLLVKTYQGLVKKDKTGDELLVQIKNAASGDAGETIELAEVAKRELSDDLCFEWTTWAARFGSGEAEYLLGKYAEDGYGTEKNVAKALAHYKTALSNGYDDAEEEIDRLMGELEKSGVGNKIQEETPENKASKTKSEVLKEEQPALKEEPKAKEKKKKEKKIRKAKAEKPKKEKVKKEKTPKAREGKKLNLKPLLYLLISVAVVLLVVAIGYYDVQSNTIDMTNYVYLEVSGCDGYGSAEVKLDEEKLISDFGEETARCIIENTSITYNTHEENLSNGDEKAYDLFISDENIRRTIKKAYRFVGIESTIKVSGLEEVEKFNPFESIELTYEGASPYITVSLNYTGELFSSSDFSINPSSNLSEGDTITVTLNWNGAAEYYAYNYGKFPSETEKEYQVENVGKYATSSAEVSDRLKNEMQEQAQDVIKAYIAGFSENVPVDSVNYVGDFLLSSKEENNANQNYYGVVYKIVTRVKKSDKEYIDATHYFDVRFKNIVTNTDGSSSCDIMSYETSGSYGYEGYNFRGHRLYSDLENDYVRKFAETYNIEWNVGE